MNTTTTTAAGLPEEIRIMSSPLMDENYDGGLACTPCIAPTADGSLGLALLSADPYIGPDAASPVREVIHLQTVPLVIVVSDENIIYMHRDEWAQQV